MELALLRYRLPRLRGRGTSLSQQAGGIGTRGPGETQLEVDRRRLVRRMHRLEADLREVERTRSLQRRSRARGRHRELALVGYTNAGKSTLLNRLTDAGVLVENRLFSTLDPRTRQLSLPGGETVLRHRHRRLRAQAAPPAGRGVPLHPRLGAPGRSARPRRRRLGRRARGPDRRRCATVLGEIGAAGVPELLVVNKADRAPEAAKALAHAHEGAVRRSRPAPARGSTTSCGSLGDRLRGADRVVRARRALGARRRPGRRPPRGRGRRPERRRGVGHRCRSCSTTSGRARFAEFVRGARDASACRRTPTTAWTAWPSWPRRTRAAWSTARSGRRATRRRRAVVEALATSGTERGYPASAGSPALREAAAALAGPALRAVDVDPGARSPRAWAPRSSWPRCRTCLRLRTPGRDTVLYPAVSYPTYAMGAELAGLPRGRRSRAARTAGGLDLGAVDAGGRRAGPGALGRTRRRTRPAASATSARRRRGGGRTASRCSPTSATPSSPGTARRARSSSTAPTAWWPCTRCRSAPTWPGCGSASTPATPSWSSSCRACASTPGSWCPGPVQAAGVAALGDDDHVEAAAGALPASAWRTWPASSGRTGCPVDAARGRLLPVGARCRPARWPDALGAGRGAGRGRRAAGQPGRPLRRRRRRARAGRRGPADGR